MFNHYLTTALRHFRQHKVTTSINIACLAFGLMCFLGVYGLIAYLQGGDRHIPHANRVFALTQQDKVRGSDTIVTTMPSTAWVVAKQLASNFPQLEAVARMTNTMPRASGASLKSLAGGMDAKVRYADTEIFDVLRLPLLAGDTQALRAPRSIVISNTTAVRLFGSTDRAFGRDVVLFGSTTLTVTGVLDAIPQPSHLSTDALSNPFQRFDVLVSMDVYESRQRNPESLRAWYGSDVATYIVLPKDGSLTAKQIRDQLPSFVKRNAPPSKEEVQLGLQPLSFIALSSFDSGLRILRTGISSVAVLYALGGLVLLIACLNYANLALAQSIIRAREIGLRRVVGATRLQVMTQHLFEASLASTLAAVIALALLTLILLAMPFNHTLDAAGFFMHNVLPSWQLWLTVCATVCGVTLVAGSYPAFVLSNVRPIHAVRTGQEKSARRRVAALIVGAQFVSASFLLITILVMQAQSNYIRDSSLATLDDPFLVLANYSDTPAKYETLRAELLKNPHVKSVTAAVAAPWEIHNMGGPGSFSLTADPQATRRSASRHFDNEDFFATLDFTVLAGRVLSVKYAADNAALASQSPNALTNLVVDRSFIDDYGWNPPDAIGKTLYYWNRRDGQYLARPVVIVGVVESKPLSIIQFGVNANAFFFDPTASNAFIVRIDKQDVRAGVQEVDAAWNRVAPNVAIQRQFADEALNKSMWMIDMISRVFGIVAIAAMIIAMLGLVGVSIHATHRRMHEIAVRKTLGAGSRTIFAMLLKDFSKPVLIANLIAWPLAFVLMRAYLSIFTQSAGLSIGPFISSLVITILVAWIAVTAQVMRATRLNPATVLRNE